MYNIKKAKCNILFFMIVASIISCRGNKSKEARDNSSEANIVTEKLNPYELSLLDYREINQQFNPNFKIDKFGVRKYNDSTFYFVLRLNDSVSEAEVAKYSMGVIAYDHLVKEDFQAVTNIKARRINDKNYLVINRVPKDTEYLDSIEFYIYQKNNFKASGKLGKIKVFDILFE